MNAGEKLIRILNSPIVIVLVVLIALPFVLGLSESYRVKMMAGQVRQELKEFVSDTGDLKEIASDVSGQLVEGFKQGFSSSGDDGEAEKHKAFSEVKKSLVISDVKYAHTSWASKEKIIGRIRNDSGKTIKNIYLSVSYLDKNGELIDVGKEWVSDIQYLQPGYSSPFTFMRDLGGHDEGKEVLESRKSHKVIIQAANFKIVPEEKQNGEEQ